MNVTLSWREQLLHSLNCSDPENKRTLLSLINREFYVPDPDLNIFHTIVVKFIFIIVMIMGISLNLLSVWVLSRDRNYSPSVFLLQILALVDTYYLGVLLFIYYIPVAILYDQGINCNVSGYLTFLVGPAYTYLNSIAQTARTMEVGVVTILTIERYIVIFFPLQAGKFLTMKAVKIQLLCLIIYDLSWFALFVVPRVAFPKIRPVVLYVLFATNAIVNLIIPVLTVSILTGKIVFALRRAHAQRQLLTRSDRSREESRGQTIVSIRLVAVALSFLLCVIPTVVIAFDFLMYIIKPGFLDLLGRGHTRAVVNILAIFLMCINASMNFFLYFMTGKRFRKTMVLAISQCCQPGRPKFRYDKDNGSMCTTYSSVVVRDNGKKYETTPIMEAAA